MDNTDKSKIMALVQKGYGYKKIASTLNMNLNTVKSFIRRLPNKEAPQCMCAECGKSIVQTPHLKPKRFCSESCRTKWWSKHRYEYEWKSRITFICQYCGKEFRDDEKKERKFCSTYCFQQSRRTTFETQRQESDARTAPCGTELSDLPSDCLCASCRWFVDAKRVCYCKKALAEKI